MARYAIITDGTVENIVKAEASFAAEQGWAEAPAHVSPGWLYDGQTWSEPPPPPVTAEQVLTERDQRMQALASTYTQTERETWHVQVTEARAVLVDPAAPAPLLTPLAQARGITITEMAQRVITLSDQFAAATGAIMARAAQLIAMDPIPTSEEERWPSA